MVQHVVQQFKNGANRVGIHHVLGQLQICSVRIQQRNKQFLETVRKILISIESAYN